jgi:hypothetical protein
VLSVSSQWPSAQEADGVLTLSPTLFQAYHDMLVNRPASYGHEDPITCLVTRQYGRWAPERWRSHFAGDAPLALDGMSRSGKSKWICFGLEVAHALAPLQEVQRFLQVLGITSILEAQDSEPMLWVLFDAPLPVVPVHAFGAALIAYMARCPGSKVHADEVYVGPDFVPDFPSVASMCAAPLSPDFVTGRLPRCSTAESAPIRMTNVAKLVSWWVRQPRNSVGQIANAFHLLYCYEGSPFEECRTFVEWLHGHYAHYRPRSS